MYSAARLAAAPRQQKLPSHKLTLTLARVRHDIVTAEGHGQARLSPLAGQMAYRQPQSPIMRPLPFPCLRLCEVAATQRTRLLWLTPLVPLLTLRLSPTKTTRVLLLPKSIGLTFPLLRRPLLSAARQLRQRE